MLMCFFFADVITPGDSFTITGGEAGDGESGDAGDWPLGRYSTTNMFKQARVVLYGTGREEFGILLRQDTVR